MSCEICGNKPMNCDCTQEARELHALREEIPEFFERALKERGMAFVSEQEQMRIAQEQAAPLLKKFEKQRERREFVKAYTLAVAQGRAANPVSDLGQMTPFDYYTEGVYLFDGLDKQLTELEKGEG